MKTLSEEEKKNAFSLSDVEFEIGEFIRKTGYDKNSKKFNFSQNHLIMGDFYLTTNMIIEDYNEFNEKIRAISFPEKNLDFVALIRKDALHSFAEQRRFFDILSILNKTCDKYLKNYCDDLREFFNNNKNIQPSMRNDKNEIASYIELYLELYSNDPSKLNDLYIYIDQYLHLNISNDLPQKCSIETIYKLFYSSKTEVFEILKLKLDSSKINILLNSPALKAFQEEIITTFGKIVTPDILSNSKLVHEYEVKIQCFFPKNNSFNLTQIYLNRILSNLRKNSTGIIEMNSINDVFYFLHHIFLIILPKLAKNGFNTNNQHDYDLIVKFLFLNDLNNKYILNEYTFLAIFEISLYPYLDTMSNQKIKKYYGLRPKLIESLQEIFTKKITTILKSILEQNTKACIYNSIVEFTEYLKQIIKNIQILHSHLQYYNSKVIDNKKKFSQLEKIFIYTIFSILNDSSEKSNSSEEIQSKSISNIEQLKYIILFYYSIHKFVFEKITQIKDNIEPNSISFLLSFTTTMSKIFSQFKLAIPPKDYDLAYIDQNSIKQLYGELHIKN